MCGLAGIVSLGGEASKVLDAVGRMTDAMRHRGPDDGAMRLLSDAAPVVAFGHRRLSIIDLSANGQQPMTDAASGTSIIFNGEIFNFRALRAELQAHGHVFQTLTDTEVILRGYLAWGEHVVARLNGMFAFAIWDGRNRGVLLARDALGVKPLYVHEVAGKISFASEVRALLASGGVERRLDLDGVRSYLAYGSVQHPLTLVRGVRSLAPGHLAWVREGAMLVRPFWTLPLTRDGEAPRQLSLPAIREALVEAVQSQLVADVPLGAFLSGGIDSSAIALLMREGGASDVRTFNVCFADAAYDERTFARRAAEAAGAVHHDIEFGVDEFHDQLPTALAAYDQPSVDGVNTWFISRAVRAAGLTVALAGVGGDELFVGYGGFAKARRAEWATNLSHLAPKPVRIAIGKRMQRLGWSEGLRKAGALLSTPLPAYFSVRRVFGPVVADRLLAPEHRDGGVETWTAIQLASLDDALHSSDPINRISALELRTYMLSTLLRDTDQMSMAHALEVRVPLIDQSLVEVILPLPGESKLSRTTPKPLLVDPLNGMIPDECVHRPKRGFTLPYAEWLRQGAGAEAVEARLGSRDGLGPLDRHQVDLMRADFRDGRVGWSRVWGLFVLADWCARHEITA